MCKRLAIFAAAALILFALSRSQALAESSANPTDSKVSRRPMARLDPSFGQRGFVVLPPEVGGFAADGAAMSNGDLTVSSGSSLQQLASSGALIKDFGGTGLLRPMPRAGAEFSLAAFTVDPRDRLLVVGTARYLRNEGEGPHGSNGEALAVPSTVQILRFLPDGSPDLSFGAEGVVETDFGLPPPRDQHGKPFQREASVEATGIAVGRQGQIVVTGGAAIRLGPSCKHDLFSPVSVSAAFVARLTGDGIPDASFGREGIVGGRALSETPLRAGSVGDPVVSGSGQITYRSTAISACPSNHGRWGVAQLAPDGKTRMGLGRKGAVGGFFTALAGEHDGSVVGLSIIGRKQAEPFRARLIRITPGGKVDRSFGQHGRSIVQLGKPLSNEANALVVDSRGRALLGGALVTAKRHSILLIRLNAAGHQEANFRPHGRVATPFPGLAAAEPSDLILDRKGRVVTVHRYHGGDGSGLVLARYLLRG